MDTDVVRPIRVHRWFPTVWAVCRVARIANIVSGAKLAPQGRLRKAQGASPGNKHSNKGSPEGAMQLVPVPKRRLMTSIYLELRSNSLRRPFRAFRNLDLEPRACALGCPAGPLRGPWFRARNYLGRGNTAEEQKSWGAEELGKAEELGGGGGAIRVP